MISARMICDSISEQGIRPSTIQVTMPKFLLAQLNTHRMFSRNAASSRAIPTSKLIERVQNNPVVPIYWGKNRPGMQATEEVKSKDYVRCVWESALSAAKLNAQALEYNKVHKQITNRLLEPFMYVDVLITATEWDNFFDLRLHDSTQPEMREVARVMRNAMDYSTPKILEPGEWHLPYVTEDDDWNLEQEDQIKCSVARCARVSYLNHDQSNPDLKKDLELYELLHKEKHLSPFEHQATPMKFATDCNEWQNATWEDGITHTDRESNYWSGNLKGWIQNRQLVCSDEGAY